MLFNAVLTWYQDIKTVVCLTKYWFVQYSITNGCRPKIVFAMSQFSILASVICCCKIHLRYYWRLFPMKRTQKRLNVRDVLHLNNHIRQHKLIFNLAFAVYEVFVYRQFLLITFVNNVDVCTGLCRNHDQCFYQNSTNFIYRCSTLLKAGMHHLLY